VFRPRSLGVLVTFRGPYPMPFPCRRVRRHVESTRKSFVDLRDDLPRLKKSKICNGNALLSDQDIEFIQPGKFLGTGLIDPNEMPRCVRRTLAIGDPRNEEHAE